jgi:DNA helicase-4
MKLASKSFLGFLVDPLGRHPRSLILQEEGIAARGAGSPWIGLEAIATRPTVSTGLLSSSLSIDLAGGRKLTLPAVDASGARNFADAAAAAWTDFNRAELEKEEAAVRRILQALDALKVPDAYPAACHMVPLARDAADLNSRVLSKLNAEAVGDKMMSRIAPITAFASDPNAARNASIAAFVEAQLLRWKDFFDMVESMPLTPEQRLSVVVDEDATLVLAGVGQDERYHRQGRLPRQGWDKKTERTTAAGLREGCGNRDVRADRGAVRGPGGGAYLPRLGLRDHRRSRG